MTPGNTNPNRYKKASALSAAVLALALGGAPAIDILEQFLNEKEGVRLVAYKDGKGLWTICRGLTRVYGKPVKEGMRFSRAECNRLDREELEDTLVQLKRIVRPEVWDSLSEPAKAGIASFCVYNIGVPTCLGSTFFRELQALASRNETCAQITRWIRDGGRDCRVDPSCRGQPPRRMGEDQLCLMEKPQ